MDTNAPRQLHQLKESSLYTAHPSQSQLQNHQPRTSYLEHDSQANSHEYGASFPDNQHPDPPSGRFTEEWDASQRGSSIVDGHRSKNKLTMQRAASVTSYAAGDDTNLPIRSNTLKKKGSVRRTSSLGRSASRRSNRAGSVRSLALQSSLDPDEAHSVFFCPVPTSGNPTSALADRFQCKYFLAGNFVPSAVLHNATT